MRDGQHAPAGLSNGFPIRVVKRNILVPHRVTSAWHAGSSALFYPWSILLTRHDAALFAHMDPIPTFGPSVGVAQTEDAVNLASARDELARWVNSFNQYTCGTT